jgi:hypothetical protein
MKKLNLNNLYESSLPPERTDVLWVSTNKSTGDIESISRFKNGLWELYLVSTDFFNTKKNTESEETDTNDLKE